MIPLSAPVCHTSISFVHVVFCSRHEASQHQCYSHDTVATRFYLRFDAPFFDCFLVALMTRRSNKASVPCTEFLLLCSNDLLFWRFNRARSTRPYPLENPRKTRAEIRRKPAKGTTTCPRRRLHTHHVPAAADCGGVQARAYAWTCNTRHQPHLLR